MLRNSNYKVKDTGENNFETEEQKGNMGER